MYYFTDDNCFWCFGMKMINFEYTQKIPIHQWTKFQNLVHVAGNWNLTCILLPCSPGALAGEDQCLAGSHWRWNKTECGWRSHAWCRQDCTCTGRPAVGWSQKWRRWQRPRRQRTAYLLTAFMKSNERFHSFSCYVLEHFSGWAQHVLKTKLNRYKTYINNDCYLTEASQEVVPDTCRKTEEPSLRLNKSFNVKVPNRVSKYQPPLDGTSTHCMEILNSMLC